MNEIQYLLTAPATLLLLVANIGLSMVALQNSAVMERVTFDVGRIRRNKQWDRWVTSGFAHTGPIHLFLNMFALYSVGPIFEHGLGLLPFLVLYFGSLLGSSALMWLEHFRDPLYRAVGASGALSGLMLAFAMFQPMAEFQVLFMFPMPAFVFSIFYIGISAWASTSGSLPGVAHAGHLGGDWPELRSHASGGRKCPSRWSIRSSLRPAASDANVRSIKEKRRVSGGEDAPLSFAGSRPAHPGGGKKAGRLTGRS